MANACFEFLQSLGSICVMRVDRRRGYIFVIDCHLVLLLPPASVQLSLEILEAERQIVSHVFIVWVDCDLLLIGDLSLLFGICARRIIVEKRCLVQRLSGVL